MKYRREYDKRVIGENLRFFREQKNMSVEQVRRYLRIGSQQAIYKWEEGVCYPQTDTLLALMELYDVEWRDIIYSRKERSMLFMELLRYELLTLRCEEDRKNVCMSYIKKIQEKAKDSVCLLGKSKIEFIGKPW